MKRASRVALHLEREVLPRGNVERGPSPRALENAVDLLSAMAHPARLRVLLALCRRGPQSAGVLATLCGLEQSAASHQLRVLRDARLVESQRDGKRIIYRLVDEHVAQIVEDAVAHAAES
ncbi:MAG: helix-turn-helix transcriptional regulator [Myxococcales bacterium]|nr:helix-turn-helix transcriptional regulator [Myxococcales bacterium]